MCSLQYADKSHWTTLVEANGTYRSAVKPAIYLRGSFKFPIQYADISHRTTHQFAYDTDRSAVGPAYSL